MCSRHTNLKDEEKHPATGAMAPITLLSVDSNTQFAITVRNKGIASACKSKKTEVEPTTKRSHHVGEQFDDAEPEGAYSLYNISNSKAEDPIYVGLTVNGFHVTMELDTGSGLTLINEETYSKIGQPNQLNPFEKASVILKTYTGQQINVLGTAQVVVCYHGREEVLPVQVVKGVGPNLLGGTGFTNSK